MSNDDLRRRVAQAKMDALGGKNIHSARLARLKKLNWLVGILGLAVPVLFWVLLGLPNNPYVAQIRVLGAIASGALFVLGLIKLLGRWDDLSRTHANFISENLMIKYQADDLLGRSTLDDAAVASFLKLVEITERADAETLVGLSPKEKQHAYLGALKEAAPSDPSVLCPVCHANPYSFVAGSCDTCGGTPVSPAVADKTKQVEGGREK